jgi:GNAT superfamily N-acetyltransferase
MDFRIYPLTDTARLPELCALFAKGLGETLPQEWLWRNYTENGMPEGIVSVAEDEYGIFRAVFAMQPVVYRRGQEQKILVQTQGLVIDPECRGQGLMRKLFQYNADYYRQQGAEALTSFSCNELSYPIFMKYGAKDLGALNGVCTGKRLLPRLRRRKWARDGWQIQVQDEMPSDLFLLPGESVFKMEKNLRFMQWKFTENPNQHYQWLTIRRDGKLMGYFVFYVNHGRLRSAVNICDWELQAELPDEILKKAVDLLHSLGNWVHLWGMLSPENLSRWQKAGLTCPSASAERFVYFPLTDWEIPSDWFITKADSDN